MFSRNFEEIRALSEAELIGVGFSESEAEDMHATAFMEEIREVLERRSGKPRCFAIFWVGEADTNAHAVMGTRFAPGDPARWEKHNADASGLFHNITLILPLLCAHRRPDEDDGDGPDDEPVVDPDPSSPDMAQS